MKNKSGLQVRLTILIIIIKERSFLFGSFFSFLRAKRPSSCSSGVVSLDLIVWMTNLISLVDTDAISSAERLVRSDVRKQRFLNSFEP